MMRWFTLATISSTIAARASVMTPRRGTRARRSRRAAGGLIPVLARVVEGKNGAIDMDLRVLLEVGDVALESLLPLLAERLQLEGGLLDLGRQIILAEGPGLPLVRRRRVVPGQTLELRRVLRQLGGQLIGQALIIDQDLTQDNRTGNAGGLGLLLEIVVDLPRRYFDLAEDRLVLHLLEDEALADLVPEGLLPFRTGDLGLSFADADLAQVVVDLRFGHRDAEPLRGPQQELLFEHLVEEAALDGVALLGVVVLGVAGVVGEVAIERLERHGIAPHGGDDLGVEHRLGARRCRCRGGSRLGRRPGLSGAGGKRQEENRRGARTSPQAAHLGSIVLLGRPVPHLSSAGGPTAVGCEAGRMLSPVRIDFKRSRTAAMRHWSTAGRIVPGGARAPSRSRRRTPAGVRLTPGRLEARLTRTSGWVVASSENRIWTRPDA